MRMLLVALCLCVLSCGGDDDSSPVVSTGVTKTFAIALDSRVPCSEANAQYICRQLGYEDCTHYKCQNYDNSGVFIHEVTCWKP